MKKPLLVILGTVFCLSAVMIYFTWPVPPSMPMIQPGVYFGELRGFDGNENSRVPLYVESIAKTSSILVVPMLAGASPEMHPWIPSARVQGSFEPLVIRVQSLSVAISGVKDGESYSGTIQPAGSWSLHPLEAKKLRESSSSLQASVGLPRWLQSKAQSAATSTELAELQQAFTKEKERLRGLEELMGNQKLLKERSQSRREALATEITLVTEKKRKLAEDLRNSLDDLSVLHRIRLDGQTVETARRILKREERWFDGATGDESADESLEEQLAANDKVDLQKLNSVAKRAEEIQELRRALADEQSQVQILSAEYKRQLVHRVPRRRQE